MAHDVFISYSSVNKIVADAVCAGLESRKIRCWIAPRDVVPGGNYGEAIVNGIERCDSFVLIYSSATNVSPAVMREAERAVHFKKNIIPFRIEDVPMAKGLEFFLASCHWLDAMTPPLEQHILKLATSLKSVSRREPATDQPLYEVQEKIPSNQTKWGKRFLGIAAIVCALAITICLTLIRFDKPMPIDKKLTPKSISSKLSELPNHGSSKEPGPSSLQILPAPEEIVKKLDGSPDLPDLKNGKLFAGGCKILMSLRHLRNADKTIAITGLVLDLVSFSKSFNTNYEVSLDKIFGEGSAKPNLFRAVVNSKGISNVSWTMDDGSVATGHSGSPNLLDVQPPRYLVIRNNNSEDVSIIQGFVLASQDGLYEFVMHIEYSDGNELNQKMEVCHFFIYSHENE